MEVGTLNEGLGLGFNLGFKVRGLGFRVWVWGLGLRVWGAPKILGAARKQ